MIKHGRGVAAADPVRSYAWMKLAALHGNKLAERNLRERPFTTTERIAGLAQLADIERRLLAHPTDPKALRRGPWY